MKKLIFCFNVILAISVFFITCSPTEPEKVQLSVQPTSFTFTKNANLDTLILSNSGSGELSWEITDKPEWLDVSKSSGNVITGKDTVIVIANVNQAAGTYSGAISITSNRGNKEVTVSLDIRIWVKKRNMPTARNAHAVGTVNGKIYAVGGYQSHSNAVEEYDPVTDNWTTKAYMLTGRSWLSCIGVNEKIYTIGGYHRAFAQSTVSIVEEYDPASDSWTTKSPMPTARWGHDTGTISGKIYVVGGALNWPVVKMYEKIEEYDPVTDTWTTKSSTLSKRWGLSCCVVNGKIYAVGGYYYGSVSTVEEYDPVSDTWTTKSPMPTARWGLTTGTVNGKIYAIGGGNVYPATQSLTTVEEYDPVTDTWTTKSPMPVGRIAHAPSSVSIDGKIYVIGGGGINESEAYAEVYEYEPGIDTSN